MFSRYSFFVVFGIANLASVPTVGQETELRSHIGSSGAGGSRGAGTFGQDQYSFVEDPTLPPGEYNPSDDDRKRLHVEWGEISVGYVDYEQCDDGDDPVRQKWKDDDSLHPDRRLSVRGRLLFESSDGKTRQPIDWVQGVRVIVSRRPDQNHDWSRRHELHEVDFDDVIIRQGGEFHAMVSPGAIIRPVGREATFQVALSLAKRKGNGITWKNTEPVLPQSVSMLNFPGPPAISETMRIINGAPSYSPRKFNPGRLVRAVNHLRPMGKEKALHELHAFLEVARDTWGDEQRIEDNIDTSDNTSVFLIVRLLFEPADPSGQLPPILTVPFTPVLDKGSSDRALWPLHPVHLQDDVPFLLVYGGGLGGMPEHPSSHLDWAEKYGKIRIHPLQPEGNPMRAAERLAALPQTERLFSSDIRNFDYKRFLLQQALNSVNAADPQVPEPPPIPPINSDADEDFEERWNVATNLDVEWDEEQQCYVVNRR